MSIIGFFDSCGRELRHAVRGLLRRPAFTFAAVLTLALGIGATTAIFSVVYSVLIKPLPYPHADELVRLRHSVGGVEGAGADFEATLYYTYRDENRTFADIGLWQEGSVTLTDGGEPERLRSINVTQGTLQALGVQPTRGRWFTEQEHGPAGDGPAPVIISHAYWNRRFGGDEGIVGRSLTVDGKPAQVVGVMPPGFRFLDMAPQPDMILAVQLDRAALKITGGWSYQGLARLKPGVTPEQARADMERMQPIWREVWPLPDIAGVTRETLKEFKWVPVVRPLKDDIVGGVQSMLWVLMGAIGAVLLVACANIANLMLVRADARRQELAVRAALGAMPARIARELLLESLVIGAAGCALGLTLAYLGLAGLVALGPSNLPRLSEIGVYAPVLAFTVTVSLASTLVFGSITALKHALHIDTSSSFAARGATSSRERGVTRNALVVVQVALALVLVVSAALMIRTFQALRDVDPGFSDPASIQTARIWLPGNALVADPVQYTRLQHEILDKMAALPGVTAVGFASGLPMEGVIGFNRSPIVVEGQPRVAGELPPAHYLKFVSPGYFAATGGRIIAGRDITWRDIDDGGRAVLVSEAFARQYFGAEPAGAIGKHVRTYAETDAWREIVGVVKNVHENGLYEAAPSFVYWPVLSKDMYASPVNGTPFAAFTIRSPLAGTATFMHEVRQAVWSVNASIPVTHLSTMASFYSASLARTSFVLVMLATAGGMALLLGVIGIYGVIAYGVSQRTKEIGIRSALGAEPRQLKKMFLLHGLRLSGIGVVLGAIAAAALGRSMSSLLFGIPPMDPAAHLAAIGVIVVAAALASYLPARRAAMIDPIETLRAD